MSKENRELIAQLYERTRKAQEEINELRGYMASIVAERNKEYERATAAEARAAALETQLTAAAQLLAEPIGHNVGLLCVAEAVRQVLAQLNEQTSRATCWERNYAQSETKTMKEFRLRAEKAEARAAEAESARLREELGYIANAKRKNFRDAEEFRDWAQNRARHALNYQHGTLIIKKEVA